MIRYSVGGIRYAEVTVSDLVYLRREKNEEEKTTLKVKETFKLF